MEQGTLADGIRDTRSGTTYTFRQYEPGDETGVLSLYETVWGERYGVEWFHWRYNENPYVDDTTLFVVEADGDIVATRPFFVLPMRAGTAETLALQSIDTVVHPDHRRRGLFSWTTAEAVRYFRDREPSFVFNQPTAAARAGFLDLGWREVDPVVTFYRVQNPAASFDARYSEPLGRALGTPLAPALRGYLELKDRLATVTPDYATETVDGVPAAQLEALYERWVPDAIHANREAAYYRWRFASPAWERTTYVAKHGHESVAAILTRTRETHAGVVLTQLADVVPLGGDRRWIAALASLVRRIVDDHRDSDVLSAPQKSFPDPLLAAFGFHPDDRLPLSPFTSADARLIARPLAPDDDWTFGGLSLTDPEHWLLGFGEHDTV